MRAPNRFRKLLVDQTKPKEKRDEFGLDFWFDEKNAECIERQIAEFSEIQGKPIGFQATIDNDIAICWDEKA